MRKALLVADERSHIDPATLTVHETQCLIEKYPAVISRQFMIKVFALIKFIKTNDEVFQGKLKDLWYRIEFQSPHLHMVNNNNNKNIFTTLLIVKLYLLMIINIILLIF